MNAAELSFKDTNFACIGSSMQHSGITDRARVRAKGLEHKCESRVEITDLCISMIFEIITVLGCPSSYLYVQQL